MDFELKYKKKIVAVEFRDIFTKSEIDTIMGVLLFKSDYEWDIDRYFSTMIFSNGWKRNYKPDNKSPPDNLIKKNREIFNLIEVRMRDIVRTLISKKLLTDLMVPDYWNCKLYDNGEDCLEAIDERESRDLHEDSPTFNIHFGSRKTRINKLSSEKNVSIQNVKSGSVVVVLDKKYGYIVPTCDTPKIHIHMIGNIIKKRYY